MQWRWVAVQLVTEQQHFFRHIGQCHCFLPPTTTQELLEHGSTSSARWVSKQCCCEKRAWRRTAESGNRRGGSSVCACVSLCACEYRRVLANVCVCTGVYTVCVHTRVHTHTHTHTHTHVSLSKLTSQKRRLHSGMLQASILLARTCSRHPRSRDGISDLGFRV